MEDLEVKVIEIHLLEVLLVEFLLNRSPWGMNDYIIFLKTKNSSGGGHMTYGYGGGNGGGAVRLIMSCHDSF